MTNTGCRRYTLSSDGAMKEASVSIETLVIKWEYEDRLPADISEDTFAAMFDCSKIDGVRLYPYVEIDGDRFFLTSKETW